MQESSTRTSGQNENFGKKARNEMLEKFIDFMIHKYESEFAAEIDHTKIADKIAQKYVNNHNRRVEIFFVRLLIWFWQYENLENPGNDAAFRIFHLAKTLEEIGFEGLVINWITKNSIFRNSEPLFEEDIDEEVQVAMSSEGAARLISTYYYLLWAINYKQGTNYNATKNLILDNLSHVFKKRITKTGIARLYETRLNELVNTFSCKPKIL